jgi:TonB-dependent Receptor Plug Domain
MKTLTKYALACTVAAFTCLPGALAQSAAPASLDDRSNANDKKPIVLPDKSPDGSDETLVLSPFEVAAAKDTGYAATETLAGTRIRTDLKDVSASISVVTKEFLDDIAATDSGTLLSYTTNSEVASTNGIFTGQGNGTTLDATAALRAPATDQRVRGIAAADNSRDYFITDIPWDSFNVDRMDLLRGPNSILYGLGSPAGIINESTHSAEFRNFGSTALAVDSWGSTRATLDFNQQLIPGVLSVRLDWLGYDQKYEQKQAFQNQRRIFGTVRYDPQIFKNKDFHTSIRLKFEHGEITADRPRIVTPNDSITPWWRPNNISASNPFGGMGQVSVNNPYDPWQTTGVVKGTDYGLTQSSTVNFQPWLSDISNQQQPIWFINGSNNQLYQAYGGYINNGAINSSGAFTGVSNGLVGKNTNGMFYGLNGLPAAAIAYQLPGYQYGQYRTMSLLDSSVFDFYHNLIDGPTKNEFENWNSFNVDLSQTAFGDRVALDVTYDRQAYKRGGQALLGGSPTITMDLLKNFADYYVTNADPQNSVTNPNYGRPYVQGANNNGGSSYYSDRSVERASLFGEIRPTDFTSNNVILRLIGKQILNVVGSAESFFNENRAWQLYANSQQWSGYWNDNNGLSESFSDRAPIGVFYLGNSVIGRSSASGAGIPAIGSNLSLPSTGVYAFDTTWKGGVSPAAPWTVPANLQTAFSPATATTQASNPANYVGWNSNFVDTLLTDYDGNNPLLTTLAQKSLRDTTSYSSSWQGFFLNNALVTTLGWRYDEVKTKDVTAQSQPLNRSFLTLDPSTYTLPATFPQAQILKGHSTSGGGVLHLNNLVPHDPLPFDVSLTYNDSNNFQVTSIRRDLYGNPIANPTGKTKEYGVLLSTKDGRFSLKAVKYKTDVTGNSAGLSNPGGIGTMIQQGLKWRNVFLYQLGGYTWSTANQNSYRNTWTNAYPNETASQAQAEEDAAITGWNNIQKWLAAKGFFQAWNFTPTTQSALVDRTTYLSNPSAYAPDPSTVYSYVAVAPQGFTVTADTQSEGYEYELTANPTPNWRIALNASEATAVLNNVGGSALDQFVQYISSQLINADGTLTPAGKMPQFGNPSYALYPNVVAPWLAGYQLLKLQEGTATPELRKWHVNLITNYTFTHGLLKAVGVGGAYRWSEKVVIGYPVTASGTFDLSKPYYGPSEGLIDLWASYQHKLTRKIDWKVQLNIRNAFAKNGLLPITVEPDGQTWAGVRTKPVQEATLTNTFSF